MHRRGGALEDREQGITNRKSEQTTGIGYKREEDTEHRPRTTDHGLRVLDLGCGRRKFPGAIGADRNPNTAADVLCDFDRGCLPFGDNSFDQVRAIHVIEHVADVVRVFEELHRITRPGGSILVVTPHYTDSSSFADPTHRWHLNSMAFRFFYTGGFHGEDHWYSPVRLREKRARIRLLRLWRWLGFEFLVNRLVWFRLFWEYYLCYLIRGKVMEFEFEVLK